MSSCLFWNTLTTQCFCPNVNMWHLKSFVFREAICKNGHMLYYHIVYICVGTKRRFGGRRNVKITPWKTVARQWEARKLYVHVSTTCTLLLNYGFQNVFYIHYCVTVLGIKAICHDYKDEPDCQFCHSNSVWWNHLPYCEFYN